MADELKDLKRLKVTRETAAWLDAEAHSTGRKKHEIARDALHELAVAKIHAAKVLVAMAPGQDRGGATEDHTRDFGGRRR